MAPKEEEDKKVGYFHYKNSLLLESEKAAQLDLKKYRMGILPVDKLRIAACFLVFYSILTGIFILTVKLNMMADGAQVLWVYFAMMLTGFMCIAFAVSCGKYEDEHKKVVERTMTKEVSSAQV
jgi:hypothetical protein